MNDAFKQDFARFAKEKLQPVVSTIASRKRTGLVRGLIAGVVLFLIGSGVTYTLLAPYRELMKDHNLTLWPLLLLAPIAVSILVFSLVYVLGLRKTVVDFRRALAGVLGEFIDPALVVGYDCTFPRDVIDASHLFTETQRIQTGPDMFQGRSGNAAVKFADIVVREGKSAATAERGLFLAAQYENSFPHPFFMVPLGVDASRSGFEKALTDSGYSLPEGLVRVQQQNRQVLVPANETASVNSLLPQDILSGIDGFKSVANYEFFLAARGNSLYLAFLAPNTAEDASSIFENFNLDACREFTRAAKLGLALAARAL